MTDDEREPVEMLQDRASIPAFDKEASGVFGPRGPKAWVLRTASRRHWGVVGRALQVQQRFDELRGGELAASVTLQAFLGLFPLLLVAIAIVGAIQAGSGDFASRVIDNLGVRGAAATQLHDAFDTAAHSRRVSSAVGVVGLLWSGLGFTAALRLAFNRAWQVADRGWKDKPLGLLWCAGAALLFVAGAGATAAMQWLPVVAKPLALLVGLTVGFALFLWTTRVLPNIDVGWRPLVPGAMFGAVGLVVLNLVGAIAVPRLVASASALWGALGAVFAVLAWLTVFGRLVVYVAMIGVVLFEADAGTVVTMVSVPNHPGATRVGTRSGASRPGAPSAYEPDPSGR